MARRDDESGHPTQQNRVGWIGRIGPRLVIALVLVLAAATACSKEHQAYDGPRSDCSTGTPYPFETTFPSLAQPTSNDLPQCVARCGDTSRATNAVYGSAPTISALPTGQCQYDGELCTMAAVRERLCPDGTTVNCSLTGYECHCEDSMWRCYSVAVGASACSCQGPPDAGSEAGPDSGS